MNSAKHLASFFRRDLSRLVDQLRAIPSDEELWATPPGITNSAGTLALHLDGNLREYIGRQIGGTAYTRDRPAEFSTRGVPREELIHRFTELRDRIPLIVERLSSAELEATYPEVVLDAPMQSGEFLLHLYGHLNWHRGQLDFVSRVVSAELRTSIPSDGDRVR